MQDSSLYILFCGVATVICVQHLFVLGQIAVQWHVIQSSVLKSSQFCQKQGQSVVSCQVVLGDGRNSIQQCE